MNDIIHLKLPCKTQTYYLKRIKVRCQYCTGKRASEEIANSG